MTLYQFRARPDIPPHRQCTRTGCHRLIDARGLCNSHYQTMRRHERWTIRSITLHRTLDIDPIVVQRLTDGDPITTYTTGERRDATRILRARGYSINRIAETLGLHQAQVTRDLRTYQQEATSA